MSTALCAGVFDGIKVLGNGTLTKKVVVEADHISGSAREKIEAAGGTITLRDRSKKEAAKA